MAAAAESTHIPLAGSRRRTGRLEFDRIFFDPRRAHALAFGETARQLGVRTHALSGEVDDPCYDDLQRRWRIARTPVAGITDFRALFLLQMLASDAGLRPVLRIHHCRHGASTVHEVFGSSAYRETLHVRLSHAGMHWSRAAARLVLDLAANDLGDVNELSEMCRDADMSTANMRALDSRALVTWAIA
jgi:hypothetical protein